MAVRLFNLTAIKSAPIYNQQKYFTFAKAFACKAGAARHFVALNVVARSCEQAPRHALLIIRREHTENISKSQNFFQKFFFGRLLPV